MTSRHAPSPTAFIARTWLLLVGATLLVGYLADASQVAPRLAASIALVVAFIKARLVLLRYMELRHAPLAWRLVFEAWAVVAAGGILTAYWCVA